MLFEVFTDYSYLKWYSFFIATIIIADLSRMYNKGWVDWIQCFSLNTALPVKFTLLFLADLAAPRIMILFAFCLPLLWFSDNVPLDFLMLSLLYLTASVTHHFLLLLGNRKKVIRVIYRWASYIIFPMCIGLGGISFYKVGSEENTGIIKRAFAEFYLGNPLEILSVIFLFSFFSYVLLLLYSIRTYRSKPFIREFNDLDNFF